MYEVAVWQIFEMATLHKAIHRADEHIGARTSLPDGDYWHVIQRDTAWTDPPPIKDGNEAGAVRHALDLLVSLSVVAFSRAVSGDDDTFPNGFRHFKVGLAYGLAVRSGHAVGFICVADVGRGIFERVDYAWVAPGHRRMGIADDLLRLVADRPEVALTTFTGPASSTGAPWGRMMAEKHNLPEIAAKLRDLT